MPKHWVQAASHKLGHLLHRVWTLLEPVVEHAAISVLFAGVMFLVARVMELLLSGESSGDIHEIEALAYSLIAFFYAIHTMAVLLIRIVTDILDEVRLSAGHSSPVVRRRATRRLKRPVRPRRRFVSRMIAPPAPNFGGGSNKDPLKVKRDGN